MTAINLANHRILTSTIMSLGDSTKLDIVTPVGTVKLDGRCSRFVSHKTVEFVDSERTTQGVVFSNTARLLVVNPGPEETWGQYLEFLPSALSDSNVELQWLRVDVPETLLRGLGEACVEFFGHNFVTEYRPVSVLMLIPVVDHFEYDKTEERMRPVFRQAQSKEEAEVSPSYASKFGTSEES